MPDVEILFPREGRDDSFNVSRQPMLTTTEARNVQAGDPETGRVGGSSRGGSERWHNTQVANGRVQAVAAALIDEGQTTHALAAIGEPKWTFQPRTGDDAWDVTYDSAGNAYVVDGGAIITVLNHDGGVVRTITPNATRAPRLRQRDPQFRAIDVDAGLRLYVGVTEGGDQKDAALLCLDQPIVEGEELVKVWEVKLGGFIERVRVRNSHVFVLVNDTDANRSWVVKLALNGNSRPEEVWRAPALAPASGLTITPDGDVAVASRANVLGRGFHARYPTIGPVLDDDFADWLPREAIANYETNSYCCIDPRLINAKDGDDLFEVADVDGSPRVARTGENVGGTGPVVLAVKNGQFLVTQSDCVAVIYGVPADGDYVELESDDGQVERWTFRTAIADLYDVLIAGTAAGCLANLYTTLKNGGDGTIATLATPPSSLFAGGGYTAGGVLLLLGASAGVREVFYTSSDNTVISFFPSLWTDFGAAAAAATTSNRVGYARSGYSTPAGQTLLQPPTFRKVGAAGLPAISFERPFQSLSTRANPNRGQGGQAAAHSSHATLLPRWHNTTAGSSCRTLAFWVLKVDAKTAPAPIHRERLAKASWLTLWANGRYDEQPSVAKDGHIAGVPGSLSLAYYVGSTFVSFDGAFEGADGPNNVAASGVVIVCLQTDPAGLTRVFYNGTPGKVHELVIDGQRALTDSTSASATDRITAVTGTTSTGGAAGVNALDTCVAGDLLHVYDDGDDGGGGPVVATGFWSVLTVSTGSNYIELNDGSGGVQPLNGAAGGGVKARLDVYRNSDRVLNIQGVGANIVGSAPTHVWVKAGTGVQVGVYAIQTIVTANRVVLATALGADVTDGSLDVSALVCTAPSRVPPGDAIGGSVLGFANVFGSFRGELLYFHAFAKAVAWTTAERQVFEGYLAWRFGLPDGLPFDHPFKSAPPNAAGTTTGWYQSKKVLGGAGALTKYRQNGRLVWIATTDTRFGEAGTSIGGVGIDCAHDGADGIYSIGLPQALDIPSVRRIVDQGASYSVSAGDGAWADELEVEGLATEGLNDAPLRIATDRQHRLYVPVWAPRYQGTPPIWIRYSKTGTREASAPNTPGVNALAVAISPQQGALEVAGVKRPARLLVATKRRRTVLLTFSAQPALGATIQLLDDGGSAQTWTIVSGTPADASEVQLGGALGTTIANLAAAINDYATDFDPPHAYAIEATATTLRLSSRLVEGEGGAAHLLTAAGSAGSNVTAGTIQNNGPAVLAYDLVTTTVTDNGRQHYAIAVIDGEVRMASRSTIVVPAGVSGLSATSGYVSIVPFANEAFIADGAKVVVLNLGDRTLEDLRPSGRGFVPQRCQIMESYLGGLFFAGDANDRANWYISKAGDRYDYDYQPVGGPFSNQAIEGATSLAGLAPTAITGAVNIADDLLMVFGDHDTWRLTGHPAANGRFDLVSGDVGCAFGRAWTRDPSGRAVFFWNQENGLHVTDGVSVRPVLPGRLTRAMRAIDLTQYRIRMAWNFLYDGLDILICPLPGVTAQPVSFFWERAVNALWETERAGPLVTDVCTINGDAPQDRAMILGCSDGFLRTPSAGRSDDDGYPVNSRVLIGPISVGSSAYETMMQNVQVMLDLWSGFCTMNIYVSETAVSPRRLTHSWLLRPGLNAPFSGRCSGGYLWVEIQSQNRWALERITAVLARGAPRRLRAQ